MCLTLKVRGPVSPPPLLLPLAVPHPDASAVAAVAARFLHAANHLLANQGMRAGGYGVARNTGQRHIYKRPLHRQKLLSSQ